MIHRPLLQQREACLIHSVPESWGNILSVNCPRPWGKPETGQPSLLLHKMACMQATLNQGKLSADSEYLFVRARRLAVLATHEPAREPFLIQFKYAPLEVISGAGVYGRVQHQEARTSNLQCPVASEIASPSSPTDRHGGEQGGGTQGMGA